MPDCNSYDYAIIRVVPRVERDEFINVGVILFCRTSKFLGALTHLDEQRLLALAPNLDLEQVRELLEMISLVCLGDARAGRLAQMSPSERFHWLVAPHSTIIQASPVHCGLSSDPEATLHHLMEKMVHVPKQV